MSDRPAGEAPQCALQANFDLKDFPGQPSDRLVKRAVFDAHRNIAHARRVLGEVIEFWEGRLADARSRCPHREVRTTSDAVYGGVDTCAVCGAEIDPASRPTSGERDRGESQQGDPHRASDS